MISKVRGWIAEEAVFRSKRERRSTADGAVFRVRIGTGCLCSTKEGGVQAVFVASHSGKDWCFSRWCGNFTESRK